MIWLTWRQFRVGTDHRDHGPGRVRDPARGHWAASGRRPRRQRHRQRHIDQWQPAARGRMITDYRGDRSAAAALADVRRVQAALLLEPGRL